MPSVTVPSPLSSSLFASRLLYLRSHPLTLLTHCSLLIVTHIHNNTMAEQQWKAFTLTHITYPAEDSVHAPILALLSLLPPFGVCALTTATVIYKDVVAAYLLIGSLFSAMISAILKRVIQEPRPDRYDDDGNVEFGMPSNHSCFAWFCCTFLMMYVVQRRGVWAGSKLPSRRRDRGMSTKETTLNESRWWILLAKLWNFLHTSFTIILALFLATGCTYSRVYLEYHSHLQVYAGSVLGMGLGAFWYHLFQTSTVREFLIQVDGAISQLECQRIATCCHEDGKRD